MTVQPVLFRDDTKTKRIVHVPVAQCVISEYNPRRTRHKANIDALAQRIERNGFEVTRALWVYPQDDRYHVFAGGNRLEAVKRTTVQDVPVVLHEGYTHDEIVGLADQDNENDEYHAPVSIVDTWADYKRLSDAGWTQQRIAKAKGVSQTLVSFRLKCSEFPHKIKQAFISTPALNERHAQEIIELLAANNSWLTHETAMLEIIDAALKKGGTAKHFADLVAQYNDLIKTVQANLAELPEAYRAQYLQDIAAGKARSKAALHKAFTDAKRRVAADLAEEERRKRAAANAAEAERVKAERERLVYEKRQALLAQMVRGDARKVACPHNIKLLFTDPPYGMDFRSNRRVASEKADVLAGDGDARQALDLMATVFGRFVPHLAEDAFVLVWCDWRQQAAVAQLLESLGLTVREEVVWDKPNHTSGDLFGAPARKHEKFLFAVKGNPKLVGPRFETVLSGKHFLSSDHPTEKPVDLIETVIRSCTEKGDLVADPFMGSGSVPLTACRLEREFWGCELDASWHAFASDALLSLVEA